MIKELQEKLLQYLETTEVFIQNELPLFVEELLRWHYWHSLILFVLGITLIVAAVVVPILVYKKYGTGSSSDWKFGFGITVGISYAILMCIIGVGELLNLDWLQILLAPRVWLVEYATKLV